MIKIFFAIGIGLGVFSCFFFIWLLIFGPASSGLIPSLIALLILMAAILIYRIRKLNHFPALEISSDSFPKPKFHRILAILFFAALAFGLASFTFTSIKKPHGDWDAWAIWNLRARFLFRGGDQWTTAFSGLLEKSRPDYPLLIPGTIAGLWTSIGNDTVLIPVLLSMLFTLATVGLTVSSLYVLRGKSQAYLAGLILVGTPFLITHGASQYADVPVGFFFLATLVLLTLQDKLSKNNNNLLVLAGITAGLSAWTKNEGLIFIAAIAISRFITIARVNGLKFYLRQMLAFGLGVAPTLIILIYFKTRLAPRNYLISQGLETTLHKLMDVSRHLQVWNAFARQMTDFGGWAVSIPLLLIFYILLSGIRIEQREKLSTLASLITVGLMILAYALTFVVTPFDISWQLGTSLSRLLLQLWPSLIFVYFLIARTIEQAVAENESRAAEFCPP
ncbi:MAG: glycosyltransferase family 39 protein [Acidobacteriota bacterium]